MLQEVAEGIWRVESGRDGPSVCLSFGIHGNERPPIEAGLELVRRLEQGSVVPEAGTLHLVHANLRASAEDRRWSEGGVDLNRCFHADVLARAPRLYEERRAQEIVGVLGAAQVGVLVDFHCTVEPGRPFLMQHPPADDPAHRAVYELLAGDVLLADPRMTFGGVSFDEWMSAAGRVGICYETGWIGDPANTPAAVLAEMENVLVGTGVLAGTPRRHAAKKRIELDGAVVCDGEGFVWEDGVGENLQELAAGARLGAYADGREVVLEHDATLIFPKKRPEMVQPGKPLVYLARAAVGR